MSRKGQDGFTLIETLVALAVLALSAVALLGATQAHIARIGALESRAAAQFVLENQLAELMLGLGLTPNPPAMLGAEFDLSLQSVATGDPDLLRVDLRARGRQDGVSYGVLTGFLDARLPGLDGIGAGG